jgi:hypothetical protein
VVAQRGRDRERAIAVCRPGRQRTGKGSESTRQVGQSSKLVIGYFLGFCRRRGGSRARGALGSSVESLKIMQSNVGLEVYKHACESGGAPMFHLA